MPDISSISPDYRSFNPYAPLDKPHTEKAEEVSAVDLQKQIPPTLTPPLRVASMAARLSQQDCLREGLQDKINDRSKEIEKYKDLEKEHQAILDAALAYQESSDNWQSRCLTASEVGTILSASMGFTALSVLGPTLPVLAMIGSSMISGGTLLASQTGLIDKMIKQLGNGNPQATEEWKTRIYAALAALQIAVGGSSLAGGMAVLSSGTLIENLMNLLQGGLQIVQGGSTLAQAHDQYALDSKKIEAKMLSIDINDKQRSITEGADAAKKGIKAHNKLLELLREEQIKIPDEVMRLIARILNLED